MAAVHKNDNHYMISAKLVHWGITSIIGGMALLFVYIVIWAINDASWKARVDSRLANVEKELPNYPPQWLRDDIHEIKQDIDDIQAQLRILEIQNYEQNSD